MSWTLAQVRTRVANLLDDPQMSYLTPDFLDPLINEVYSTAKSEMRSTQSTWDIAVVEAPGIQPGTPNLGTLQAGTGILSGLSDQPERIDWKTAGMDPSYYQLVPNYGVLPDLQPQQGIFGWEYRSNVIWLTLSSIAVDLRIRGEFEPPPLTQDDSVLSAHPNVGYAVAYGTAAMVATVRGNTAWMQAYDAKAVEAMDEIMAQLVRSVQGQVRRTGRQTQRGGWWSGPTAVQ